jgi:hypothetical protein
MYRFDDASRQARHALGVVLEIPRQGKTEAESQAGALDQDARVDSSLCTERANRLRIEVWKEGRICTRLWR